MWRGFQYGWPRVSWSWGIWGSKLWLGWDTNSAAAPPSAAAPKDTDEPLPGTPAERLLQEPPYTQPTWVWGTGPGVGTASPCGAGVVPECQSQGEEGQEPELWLCREGAGRADRRGRGERQSLERQTGVPLLSSTTFSPKPLLQLLLTSKHKPCSLCCQTCNLNTPKIQSHSGPKRNSLNWTWERPQTNFPQLTTTFLFSYCSWTLSWSVLSCWKELLSLFHQTPYYNQTPPWLKTNLMPQRPKSILQVCDLTAQLDLQSTSQSAWQTHSEPSTRQC